MNKAILTAAIVGLTTALSVPAFASDSTARNPNSISPRPPSGGNGGNGGNGGMGGHDGPRPSSPRPGGGGGGTGPHS